MSTPTNRNVASGDAVSSQCRSMFQSSAHQSLSDLTNPVFWRDVLLEFVMCVFVECLVILTLTTLDTDLYKPSTTHVGLFAGFFIFVLLEGYGPINGVSVNPACCLGVFLAGRISAARSK